MLKVLILLFDEVEVLDFAGPFEVFGVARDEAGQSLFEVLTVSESGGLVRARNGLLIQPHCGFADCPPPDLLILPGGRGTRPLVTQRAVIDWIVTQNQQSQITASVCTGAFLLGAAGLLNGLEATTYHDEFEALAQLAPKAALQPGRRFTDNGRILTSAGISAGIDMSLYIVAKLFGRERALATARYMEYALQAESIP